MERRTVPEARSAGGTVRRPAQDGPLDRRGDEGLSEQRKYRTWTAKRELAIVLAGLRGDRSVKEVCRERQISDTLFYSWREKLIEGGLEALAGKEERQGECELERRIARLERRKRPGFFRVERPRQLRQLDLSSVWVAEHGWTYLTAIIGCRTREIAAWQLELRRRAEYRKPRPDVSTRAGSRSTF